MWETWVRILASEDPLVQEMATHSSIRDWKIPWTEKPGRLQSMRLQRVGYNKVTSTFFFFFQIWIFFHPSPKLNKWQFLKGCSNMECDSMNTSYSYVLKSIDLSYISNGAFYHFAIPCIDYLENNSWKLCSPANVDFDPFTVQLCYMTFINSTTDLIPPKKSRIEKLSSSKW